MNYLKIFINKILKRIEKFILRVFKKFLMKCILNFFVTSEEQGNAQDNCFVFNIFMNYRITDYITYN